MGHDLPEPLWPLLVGAIVAHSEIATLRAVARVSGPLTGYRMIEIAGIGPGPFAAMLLADMGAEVIRVERAGAVRGPAPDTPHPDILRRGRRNIAIDLKHPDGVATLLDARRARRRVDRRLPSRRHGTARRGAGRVPDRNPKLVFGRMTGWGQDGPYAHAAGHDINYISLAGALAHFGRAGGPPTPPMNMVGDFGGGGMFLAFGVVCALLEASRSGEGQVVDTAMVDGTATLMTMFWTMSQTGLHDQTQRGVNLLDTGAHFYDVYECSDGEYVSIGSIEPQFYAELMRLTGLVGRSRTSRTRWTGAVAGTEGTDRRGVPVQDPRRVVRDHGTHRRLLRSGAPDGGSDAAPAQRRPRHVRRGRRYDAAGTRRLASAGPSPEIDRPPAHDGEHTTRCSPTGASTMLGSTSSSQSGAVKQAG